MWSAIGWMMVAASGSAMIQLLRIMCAASKRPREISSRRAGSAARGGLAAGGLRFRTLLGRWRLARDTRAYVLEAHGLLDGADLVPEQRTELAAQLEWALQYAGRIDPLAGLRR